MQSLRRGRVLGLVGGRNNETPYVVAYGRDHFRQSLRREVATKGEENLEAEGGGSPDGLAVRGQA